MGDSYVIKDRGCVGDSFSLGVGCAERVDTQYWKLNEKEVRYDTKKKKKKRRSMFSDTPEMTRYVSSIDTRYNEATSLGT